jgi:hypothetical protein
MRFDRTIIASGAVALLALAALPARATGFATCDSGPREAWQPQEKLSAQLKEKGWEVRRIKEDGGCYEVYAMNEKGERVEAYFHPRTLAPVPRGAKDHKG